LATSNGAFQRQGKLSVIHRLALTVSGGHGPLGSGTLASRGGAPAG